MLKSYLLLTGLLRYSNYFFSQSVIKGVVFDDQNVMIYYIAHVCFTVIPIEVIINEKGELELESGDSLKSFEVSPVGM